MTTCSEIINEILNYPTKIVEMSLHDSYSNLVLYKNEKAVDWWPCTNINLKFKRLKTYFSSPLTYAKEGQQLYLKDLVTRGHILNIYYPSDINGT